MEKDIVIDEEFFQEKPAWEDDMDNELLIDLNKSARLKKIKTEQGEAVISGKEFNHRLQAQYKKIHRKHNLLEWAQGKPEAEEGPATELEQLLRTHTSVYQKASTLGANIIELERLPDANVEERSDCLISALEFHPSKDILLAGGLDRRLRLFSVATRSKKLSSVFFPDLPITSAHFVLDGSQIIAAGNKKHFYYFDIEKLKPYKVSNLIIDGVEHFGRVFTVAPTGNQFASVDKSGRILIFSALTKTLQFTLKMSGCGDSACFSSDGKYLFTEGEEREIYQWDLSTRKLLKREADEGSVKNTVLCTSGSFLATGCTSGVVNVYNTQDALHDKPLKSLLNLTTSITSIAMNNDLMAIASRWKKNALKLIHLPTLTAYSNFPTTQTNLKYPSSLAFSFNGKYLAVGNDEGKAHLFRFKH